MSNITLTWNPVTTDSNGNPLPTGTVVTYNLYGITTTSTPPDILPLVQSGLTTNTTVRQNADVGNHYYEVTAVISGPSGPVESALSSEVEVTITPPVIKPATPTNLSFSVA